MQNAPASYQDIQSPILSSDDDTAATKCSISLVETCADTRPLSQNVPQLLDTSSTGFITEEQLVSGSRDGGVMLSELDLKLLLPLAKRDQNGGIDYKALADTVLGRGEGRVPRRAGPCLQMCKL